ncbi:MAG: PilZ domain-containing protein, partial [Desulfobacteraceae bacterium]|nr:PilZ domain-containing protein [Desulfobacteraceae bacterium]
SDQNVELTLGFEEDLVSLKGKVIHLLNGETGKFEMGIQFTDIDEEAILVIKDFINRFRELKNK